MGLLRHLPQRYRHRLISDLVRSMKEVPPFLGNLHILGLSLTIISHSTGGFSSDQMNLSGFESPSGLDASGFNTLHYMAAIGNSTIFWTS